MTPKEERAAVNAAIEEDAPRVENSPAIDLDARDLATLNAAVKTLERHAFHATAKLLTNIRRVLARRATATEKGQ